MANEAQVVCGLQIVKDYLNYYSQPQSFSADIDAGKGPSPGAITATVIGTDVDLSNLTQPGLCRLHNQDLTNYVTAGVYDPEAGLFYPIIKMLPGEMAVFRFADDVLGEYVGTGSVAGPVTNTFRIKAHMAPCVVQVDCFDT